MALVTDSAHTERLFGVPCPPFLGEKLSNLGDHTWIAAAGHLHGIFAPPAPWPDPLPHRQGAISFDQLLAAISTQMSDRSKTFDLAVISTLDGPVKLAKLKTNMAPAIAPVGAILTGSFAANIRHLLPDRAPDSLAQSREVAIGFASLALRAYSHVENEFGGPALDWPLHAYQWKAKLERVTQPIHEELSRDEARLVEWKLCGDSQMASVAAAHREQLADVQRELAGKGFYPDDFQFSLRLQIGAKRQKPIEEPNTRVHTN